MKWVKANEKLPKDDGNRPVKVNGQYAYGNFFDLDEDKKAFSVNSSCEGYVVYPEYFNVLEWLDEGSESYWKKRCEGLYEALQGLVKDVRGKPNDTRYATHLKIADEALEFYKSMAAEK